MSATVSVERVRCLTEEQADALVAAGDLDARAPAVARHLDACAECRALVSALALVRDAAERGARWLAPGVRVGRYVLRLPLGEGGMGVVWEAGDEHLGRAVALKWLHPTRTVDEARGRALLLREARTLARLNHPNAVTVYDAGEHEGEAFIALELAPGGTLAEWLRAAPRSPTQILAAFAAAGRGLAAAHRTGIVHGDFKAENVLRGVDGVFKVTDFGLARTTEAAATAGPTTPTLTRTSSTVAGGTPFYMSPERLAGGPSTARADQYGFAVALRTALGGKKTERRIALALRRATSEDPGARFDSVDDLLRAIAPRASRRWIVVGALAACMALLGGGAVAVAVVRELGGGGIVASPELRNGDAEEFGDPLPAWRLSGGGARAFELVRTTESPHGGRYAIELRPKHAPPTGYGTAAQSILAEPYRGQRVRASVWIRAEGTTGRVDFWTRARGQSGGDGPGYGGGARTPRGDGVWAEYVIDFVVAKNAVMIDVGVGIDGPGTVWFDDARFERVRD